MNNQLALIQVLDTSNSELEVLEIKLILNNAKS